MNKSTRRSGHAASRKSPARRLVAKKARRAILKAKLTSAARPKARKKVSAKTKRRIGLAVAASPRARRFVSKVKRQVSSAISR